MPKRGKENGPGRNGTPRAFATNSSDTATMWPERAMVSDSVKATATVSPTEREIAAVAYLLWLHHGCPAGSDQEDWFRAETMLRNAFVTKSEDPPEPPSFPRNESEMVVELRWSGHWEVWEREWGGARWVLD